MTTDSPERLALAYLAAAAASFPHVNRDGEGNLGVPDDHPGAMCLGCTVGQAAQLLGIDMAGEDGEPDPDEVAAAITAWSEYLVLTAEVLHATVAT